MIVIDIELPLARSNAICRDLGTPRLTYRELAGRVGISPENLSLLVNGKFASLRRTTLDALCRELDCQPGDLLRYVETSPEDLSVGPLEGE